MNVLFLSYVVTLCLFVSIDLVWLMGPGRPIYVAEIGSLLRPAPNLTAAIAFYLIYCAGLCFFAISSSLTNASPAQALLNGMVLGLVAYATYDLTNLSVTNGFTLKIAVIDMIWGMLLSGFVAWASTKLMLLIGSK